MALVIFDVDYRRPVPLVEAFRRWPTITRKLPRPAPGKPQAATKPPRDGPLPSR